MKYVIRRAVLGLIVTPVIAGLWFLFIAVLIGLGAEPNNTPAGVWNDGLMFGLAFSIVFALEPLIRWEK